LLSYKIKNIIQHIDRITSTGKSPHLTAARIESYDDYDADFKASLGRIQAAQAAARGRLMEQQIAQFATAPEEVIRGVRDAFGAR